MIRATIAILGCPFAAAAVLAGLSCSDDGAPLPAVPGPSTTDCIEAPAEDTKLLASAIDPPAPAAIDDDDATTGSSDLSPDTLIVDLEFQLFACATDATPQMPLANTSVSVMGTAGLTPVAPTVTTDSMGNAVIELRGVAVPLDQVTAVISDQGTAITTVTAPLPDGF